MNQKQMPPLNLSPQQQEALLKMASQKLGVSAADLSRAVQNGSFDTLQKRAGPKVEQYLNDPKKLEQLLSSPQAQEFVKKLIGGR